MTQPADAMDLVARLESAADAYPEDVFTPVTDDDRRLHADVVQRSAAQMGRHFSPLLREAAAAIRGRQWLPIAEAPAEGEFLVYMPNERTKIQAASWRPNVKVIGNVFAFELTKPSHWQPLPTAPGGKEGG